jgi:predicted GIY-YIG superfamily endonuclease
MEYYVYTLDSTALNKYYVGSTSDIQSRFEKHLQNN